MRRRRSGRFMSPLSRSYRVRDHAEKLQVLFNTPDFCVTLVNDPVGVEFCGSLKNIIALGAGFLMMAASMCAAALFAWLAGWME